MKIYVAGQSIRMVGKAWQIRAKLREYKNSNLTVKEFINRMG